MSLYYKPRKKMYTNYNNTNTFDPEKLQAYSYNWWRYLDVIKGHLVFNDYYYSNTTRGHQQELKRLLASLNIKIDIIVEFPESLQFFHTNSLKPLYRKIFQLEAEISKPGTHRKKNEERKNEIISLKKQIKLLRSIGAVFSKTEISKLKNLI